MKPIPAPSSSEDPSGDHSASSASTLLKSGTPRHGNANRRSAHATVNQAYPWLLLISTAIAVALGVMYINKPVVIVANDTDPADVNTPAETNTPAKSGSDSMLPTGNTLPGEGGSNAGKPPAQDLSNTAPVHSRFEETNMRVQHILTATAEDGSISRIDLEVPVLYQSRNLRWTPAEVARAQDLMVQLMEYQDKSRQLRNQGKQLLTDWNALVGKSIPASRLRADSPSIPENQNDSLIISGPADTSTRDAVEIEPKDKP